MTIHGFRLTLSSNSWRERILPKSRTVSQVVILYGFTKCRMPRNYHISFSTDSFLLLKIEAVHQRQKIRRYSWNSAQRDSQELKHFQETSMIWLYTIVLKRSILQNSGNFYRNWLTILAIISWVWITFAVFVHVVKWLLRYMFFG